MKGLSAHINLVVPQVVPYPLPLDNPPLSREFCERRLRDITNDSPVDTTVLVYLPQSASDVDRGTEARFYCRYRRSQKMVADTEKSLAAKCVGLVMN